MTPSEAAIIRHIRFHKLIQEKECLDGTVPRCDHALRVVHALSRIGVRGRGAFSSSWRQKPYSVEALKENGYDPASRTVTLMLHTFVGKSDDEVRALAAAFEAYTHAGERRAQVVRDVVADADGDVAAVAVHIGALPKPAPDIADLLFQFLNRS